MRERILKDGNFEFVGIDTNSTEDDTILDWAAVKNLAVLNDYSEENPHLNLG